MPVTMDADLKRKFAPRRNKRHEHIRDCNAEAEWAAALDWKDNPYDFYRLMHSILERLDLQYRDECGLRLDQLADSEELLELARTVCDRYQREEHCYQIFGIYGYLLTWIRIHLAGRLRQLLGMRRQLAGDLRLFVPCRNIES